jgi:polyhydroxyalkanoate synthesis regulator phasin
MPKKKPGMSPEEQSERFKGEVERLIAAGELNPTEADRVMDDLVRRAKLPR